MRDTTLVEEIISILDLVLGKGRNSAFTSFRLEYSSKYGFELNLP
jgi:hypothetical protein